MRGLAYPTRASSRGGTISLALGTVLGAKRDVPFAAFRPFAWLSGGTYQGVPFAGCGLPLKGV